MPLYGYAGSLLFVDLTTGAVRKEPLPPELARQFVGGWGINYKLASDLIPPDVAPLSPENAIIIGAGPFCGTLVPGSAKIMATTKFPLNGAFATACGGGGFVLRLKSAGYDHVVIAGKAPRPVFLKISSEGVELGDAKSLWGKDSYETIDALRTLFEPCSVIPIGQAGENLVPASVTSVDKAGTLGRGGLPAVMGSKNLKAVIAVQGDQEIRVAHPAKFMELVNNLHERIMRWPGRQMLLEEGMHMGTEGDLAPASSGIVARFKSTKRLLACPSCPLAEKTAVRIKDGGYAGTVSYMPHLWVPLFGAKTETEAHDQAVKYNDVLNRYGLCHMTFTYLFFLLCQLYQQGAISRDDTGGLELKPDLPTALSLARMTAYREGFGDIVAQGPVEVGRRLGRGIEKYVEHIKGQSIVLDPRLTTMGTMEFDQIVNPRGAHIASGGSPSYDPGRPHGDFLRHGDRMGASPEALKRAVSSTSFNPGRFVKFSEDWYSVFNCLGMCGRAFINRFYHINTFAELYSALTGWETSPQQLMKAAERSWDLGKLLNERAGFSRRDDQPPQTWFTPREKAGQKYQITDYYHTTILTQEDVDRLVEDYYQERGCDPQTGILRPETLADLGLSR